MQILIIHRPIEVIYTRKCFLENKTIYISFKKDYKKHSASLI